MTSIVQSSSYSVSNWLLCEITAALSNCGREPFGRTFVGAGLIAWDDCCGMLVVSPERVYRYQAFPAELNDLEDCYGGDIAVNLVALAVRCVPTVDDRGRAPSVADLDAAYKEILEDAAVIWGAVSNCDLPDEWLRSSVSQAFVGADGGCIGVETRVTIGLPQRAWSMR